jgi:glycosyltransferase involved in cell wall biosynthesis
MKFALVSQALPPLPSGQAAVLWRLLGGVPPEDYCLLGSWDWERNGAPASAKLPVNYYRLPDESPIRRGYRFGLNWARQSFNIPFGVARRARRISEVLRREGCGAVVACTGDVLDIPAAYLAARRARLPFYAYIFDHYSHREWQDPAVRAWARRIEPRVLRGAAGVIAVNEVLAADLRARYGVEPHIIHNSIDLAPYESAGDGGRKRSEGGEVAIVYAGDVYEAHYDAFRNLVRAVESLRRPEVRLHLYTTRTAEELSAQGIAGASVVVHRHRELSAMPGVQRSADLLFLPLAFSSPYPELVRTSAPGKLGEYLASRRPVLVHAPRDSFVSWYCREHGCGVVVDESDPARLARAIEGVLGDEALQRELGARGWERARADFSSTAAREKFLELINGRAAERARV